MTTTIAHALQPETVTRPRAVEQLGEHLTKVYKEKFKLTPAIYVTTATAGASVLE